MDSRLKRGGAAVLAAVTVALLLHWFGPSCTTSNETMTVNGDHLLIEGDLKNWSGKEASFLVVYDLYGADGVWLGNAVGMAFMVGSGETGRLYAFGTDVVVDTPLVDDAPPPYDVLIAMGLGEDGDGVRFENAGLVTRFRLKGAVSMAF